MLKFKTPAQREQWVAMGTKNPALVDLVIDVSEYITLMFGKETVLTSILRTPEEQAALYAASPTKVVNSPHLTYEAVDLRSSLYTPEEIASICAYLNLTYRNANGKKVAIFHKIPGNVDHMHIQLYR